MEENISKEELLESYNILQEFLKYLSSEIENMNSGEES